MKTRLAYLSMALLIACGGGGASDDDGVDSGSSSDRKQTGEGPCEEPDECAGGVCVAIIDGDNPPSYCTQQCGSCPDGFWCDDDTFALAGLSFCRFGDSEPANPTPPEEPPRLPCKDDDDCETGLVCATYLGERDCTLPCSGEAQCSVSLGGVTFDLYQCAADPTPGEDRLVCLPDPDCYPDPTSCMILPF